MAFQDHPGFSEARRLDKFYTRRDVVRTCLDALSVAVGPAGLREHELWIEPSAGGGAFLEVMPHPRIAMDILPTAPGIIEQDFLAWSMDDPSVNSIVMGNPPFGRNAALAVRFFNHAAGFARRIAFIVPRTFQKRSLQMRLDPNFHLDLELVLPLDSFEILDARYSVPTVFQVWSRGAQRRDQSRLPSVHGDFSFVDRSHGEFAFQRVGVRAGAVKADFGSVASASHYFIRSELGEGSLLRERFATLDFSRVRFSTSGNPSISKREIVEAYTDAKNRGFCLASPPVGQEVSQPAICTAALM